MTDSRAIIRFVLIASISRQIPLLLIAALLLEGGRMLRFVIICMLAYWIVAGIVILRRGANPSAGDLLTLRWRFLAILLLVGVVSRISDFAGALHS